MHQKITVINQNSVRLLTSTIFFHSCTELLHNNSTKIPIAKFGEDLILMSSSGCSNVIPLNREYSCFVPWVVLAMRHSVLFNSTKKIISEINKIKIGVFHFEQNIHTPVIAFSGKKGSTLNGGKGQLSSLHVSYVESSFSINFDENLLREMVVTK